MGQGLEVLGSRTVLSWIKFSQFFYCLDLWGDLAVEAGYLDGTLETAIVYKQVSGFKIK